MNYLYYKKIDFLPDGRQIVKNIQKRTNINNLDDWVPITEIEFEAYMSMLNKIMEKENLNSINEIEYIIDDLTYVKWVDENDVVISFGVTDESIIDESIIPPEFINYKFELIERLDYLSLAMMSSIRPSELSN